MLDKFLAYGYTGYMDKNVGRFQVHVSDPYPCWVRIDLVGRDSSVLRGLLLEDLRDLRYGIEWAMRVVAETERG